MTNSQTYMLTSALWGELQKQEFYYRCRLYLVELMTLHFCLNQQSLHSKSCWAMFSLSPWVPAAVHQIGSQLVLTHPFLQD